MKNAFDNILLIYNGLLAVEAAGQQIAQLTDGNLVGEMSYVNEGVASATVRAIRPTRYLLWPKAELRQLLKRNPNMRYVMEQVFTGDLVRKLTPRHRAETWHSG